MMEMRLLCQSLEKQKELITQITKEKKQKNLNKKCVKSGKYQKKYAKLQNRKT